MCIFSGPVLHVANTKIMVAAVMQSKIITVRDKYGKPRRVRRPAKGTRPMQLTVYSNSVQLNSAGASEQTALVLPFPLIKGKNRVKVYDLTNCKKLFSKLGKLFVRENAPNFMNFDALDHVAEKKLKVEAIGSYNVSIVPNFDQFDNLQYKKFNLSPAVKKLLAQFYAKHYGFIVCILRQNATYHPFGYTHEIRPDGKLFVPTRHFHGHVEGNPFQYTDAQTRVPGGEYDEELDELQRYQARTLALEDAAFRQQVSRNTLSSYRDDPQIDWDHEIYVINYSRVLNDPAYKKDHMQTMPADPGRLYNVHRYIDSSKFPGDFILPNIKTVQRLSIFNGYKHNHDLLI